MNAIESKQAEVAAIEAEIAAMPDEPEAAVPEPSIEQAQEAEQHEPVEEDRTAVVERNLSKALSEERKARKAAEKAAEEKGREYERNMVVLNDRLEQLRQVLHQPAQKPAEQPDEPDHIKRGAPTISFDDDPAAYLKQRDEIDARRNQLFMEYIENEKRAVQERQHLGQLATAIQTHERQFVAQQPDYYQAVAHLREARVAEYEQIGYTWSDAMQIVQREELAVAQQAMRAGKSPAMVAYGLAQGRGYKTPDATAAGQAEQPRAANGQFVKTEAQSAKPAAPSIATLAAGQKEAQTLSAAHGSSSGGKLTAEALSKMPKEDFAAWLAKADRAKMKEFFGA